MTDKELYQLTHSETWPHGNQLPVIRRGGNPIRNRKDTGIVMDDNLCRVCSDVYLGKENPESTPEDYRSPEHLLSEWEID